MEAAEAAAAEVAEAEGFAALVEEVAPEIDPLLNGEY